MRGPGRRRSRLRQRVAFVAGGQEARQAVVQAQPGQLLAGVDVLLGHEVLRPLQGAEVDVDLAGIALGLVGERRTARRSDRALV